jgi:hypothetical protein
MALKNLKVWIEWGNKNLPHMTSGLAGMKAGFRESALQARELDTQLKKADATLGKLQRSIAVVGAAGAAGLGLMLQKGLQVVDTFDSINLSLEVMLKSKSAADSMMRDVVKFAATTPFEIKDVAEASKLLLAFRTSADEVIPVLRTLGEAASVMGIPLEQAIRAIVQLRQGFYESQQLAPIGINRQVLQQYGVEFKSSGQLKSSGEQAFQAAMQAMEATYGGLFSRANELLRTKISNLKDNLTITLDKVFSTTGTKAKGFFDNLNEQLQRVTNNDTSINALRMALEELLKPLDAVLGFGVSGGLSGLIDLLEQNPQALVDGVRQFVQVVEDLTAAFLAITATRALIAVVSGLASLVALLGTGMGLAVAGGVGLSLIALFNEFRKLLGGVDGDANPAGDALTRLGSNLGGVAAAMESVTGQEPALSTALNTIGIGAGDAANTISTKLIPALDDLFKRISGDPEATAWGFFLDMIGQSLAIHIERLSGMLSWLDGWRLNKDGQAYKSKKGWWESSISGPLAEGYDYYDLANARMKLEQSQRSKPESLTHSAIAETEAKLTSLGDYGSHGCVIKTRDYTLLLGNDVAGFDKIKAEVEKTFASASVQTTIPKLEAASWTARTSTPVFGDIMEWDKKAGVNGPDDGHSGIFLGWADSKKTAAWMSGNKKGSKREVDLTQFPMFNGAYSGQAGVGFYNNPFSPLRQLDLVGPAAPSDYALPTSSTSGLGQPWLEGSAKKLAEAQKKFVEEQEKAAKAFTAALYERIDREKGMAELTGETEAATERINQLLVDAGLDKIFPWLEGGLQDRITAAMEQFSEAHRERAAQLRAEIETQRQRAEERNAAEEEVWRLRLAGKDQRADYEQGLQALRELEQAQSDLSQAAKDGDTELGKFETTVIAAESALRSFILSLPQGSPARNTLVNDFDTNQSNQGWFGQLKQRAGGLSAGTWQKSS